MKTKLIFRVMAFSLTILGFTACGSAPFNITSGCIKDDFKITFVDKNIELLPNKFFTISDLGLTENSYKGAKFAASPNGYNSGKSNITSYKVSIIRNNKTYYGRIAFFQVPTESKTDAVSSYYKLFVPQPYFDKATNGSQSCFYEYTKSGSPTWIIWLSDASIF